MGRKALLSNIAAGALLLCVSACAGEDPELIELQTFLQTRDAPAPDEATRGRLNATFGRQSVRAFAYGDAATLEGERWSPVIELHGEEPRAADVTAWARTGAIGVDGVFRPDGSCGAASSAFEAVPSAQRSLTSLERRVASLECALAEIAGHRLEVRWAEGAEHAITLEGDRLAVVNPRLLELVDGSERPRQAIEPQLPKGPGSSSPAAVVEGASEPALPHEIEPAKRHDGLGVILEPILWVLFLPARLILFCCTCEWPDFTQAGRAAPLPILQNLLTVLPAALAWLLGRRRS